MTVLKCPVAAAVGVTHRGEKKKQRGENHCRSIFTNRETMVHPSRAAIGARCRGRDVEAYLAGCGNGAAQRGRVAREEFCIFTFFQADVSCFTRIGGRSAAD
ncbi:hypothetical protein H8A99_30340 [Bradyrhizobium sp. Arg68]|uniref:hypothetical protein n=1 Tax=Bradyrhizobium ivorense TaxID=2511166 RepID=UPI001E303C99|nr:hypothetical protein [Bradyrhizobium ivorense]MCC8940628.1 hypothetical protein [Bradyrhizobium ivorense]